jgi:uncharacterized protein (TIGR03435 family)
MVRGFSEGALSFASVSLCLAIGLALPALPATAQPSGVAGAAGSVRADKQYRFEVFSIRPHQPDTAPLDRQYTPDGLTQTATLEYLIKLAYISRPGLPFSSLTVLHSPDWAANDWYDINARVAPEDMAAWQKAEDLYDSEVLRSALRAALEDRCKLALHITPVDIPYWNIVLGKHGAKLKPTVPGAVKPVMGKTSQAGGGFYIQDNGKRQFVGVSMDDLAIALMRLTKDYPVQDKTGLPGRYDFTLPWLDDQQYPASEIGSPLDRMPLSSVGLMLEQGKGPGFLIDIDHIDRPSSN